MNIPRIVFRIQGRAIFSECLDREGTKIAEGVGRTFPESLRDLAEVMDEKQIIKP